MEIGKTALKKVKSGLFSQVTSYFKTPEELLNTFIIFGRNLTTKKCYIPLYRNAVMCHNKIMK